MKWNMTKCTKCFKKRKEEKIGQPTAVKKWIDLAAVPILPDGWQCGAVQQRPNINTSFTRWCVHPRQRHRTGSQSQAARGPFPEVLAAPQRHKHTQRGEAAGRGSKSQHRHVTGRVQVHFQVGTDPKWSIVGLWTVQQTNTGHAKKSASGCWRARRTACGLKELKDNVLLSSVWCSTSRSAMRHYVPETFQRPLLQFQPTFNLNSSFLLQIELRLQIAADPETPGELLMTMNYSINVM